jgi:hypothetical protein
MIRVIVIPDDLRDCSPDTLVHLHLSELTMIIVSLLERVVECGHHAHSALRRPSDGRLRANAKMTFALNLLRCD